MYLVLITNSKDYQYMIVFANTYQIITAVTHNPMLQAVSFLYTSTSMVGIGMKSAGMYPSFNV